MSAFLDLCRFIPTAGGTTDWTYSSAVGGCQSPSAAGAVNGVSYKFYAVSSDVTQWEIATGNYNSSTGVFARTTVLYNSSGTGTATGQTGAGTKINFVSAPQVSIVGLAEDLISVEVANSFSAAQKKQARTNIGLLPNVAAQCRITLTQGTAVTSADVTAATVVYLEPYKGSRLALYDGTNWNEVAVSASTYSLLATQSQTGTTHTNTTIDGLADTSQLVVGMQVSGTNIAANTTITAINSATSITVNNATTGSATNTITFKLPPSTVFDVFAYNNSGAPKLEWGPAWTNDTTRATGYVLQDGVEVKSGDATRRLLGSVRTTSIAGQLVDSHLFRWVSNRYNDEPRPMYVNDPTSTWVYSTATLRQANGNTANQLDYLATVPRVVSAMATGTAFAATTAATTMNGVGVDSTTTDSSQIRGQGAALTTANTTCYGIYSGNPGVGRHTLVWLEAPSGGSGITWTGTAAPGGITQTTGITGWVSN